ncbi:MFS transporter [Streptomyces sp. NBC_00006]|uniref:MFS transporter n=1 Tax=unclassified Streptomyces TaxID=2593676 RepID=UPI0022582EE8|nr:MULTISPECIES: MFS transporter [unclassified Streptomyces]MCX4831608.1 MFS transporter [Streptomyces sp. NBC_01016]MCX5536126.1 MFS transporter [Streptomyces sp. NBC_00006]
MTSAARSPRAGRPTPEHPAQRRVLAVLVLCQALSGAGLAAGITVGALLAEQMLGSTGLAGLPSALFTGGAALGSVGIGRLCQRWGRRPGLALGYGTGAVGSLGVVLAAVAGSVPLLFVSLLVYGAGTAANLLARYAGADLASPARRGRAVSTVLFATTFGAVIGPNLVHATGNWAHAWGIPRLAGPFLLATVAYGAASVALAVLLRPDPLLLSRERAAEEEAAERVSATGNAGRTDTRGVATGTAVMVLTQLVMIAVMTMTPVHMQAHGHGTQATGLVIALHVGAMYLPSPLTGLLVDRIGRLWLAAASGATLLAAGALAALAPPHSVAALATALVLLGLGWNFGLVSGTALITDALPVATRARTQGLVDVGISLAGATGGAASGAVVAGAGFPALGLGGGLLAVLLTPLALLRHRTRSRQGDTGTDEPAKSAIPEGSSGTGAAAEPAGH